MKPLTLKSATAGLLARSWLVGRNPSQAVRVAAVVIAGLVVAGCESAAQGGAAAAETSKTATVVEQKAAEPTPAPTVTNAVTNAVAAAEGDGTNVTNIQQITIVRPEEPQLPEGVTLNEAIDSVVKLVNSGVGEDAILAFVGKTPRQYDLDAEAIVYLNDLGVSSAVIAAMLNNDSALDPEKKTELATKAAAEPESETAPAPATAQSAPVAQAQAPSAAPQPQLGNGYVAAPSNPNAPAETVEAAPQQVVVTTQPQVIYTTPPVEVTQNYFYSPLSPYGSWMYVGGYGWCWRPTVAVHDLGWRPYYNRGRWLWSDSGWYWQSDYSWGWATFHYGRWTCPTGVGWLWVPDYTWGPSWVSWRRTDYHCGWAPLPPRSHWTGVGFSYHDRNVGFSFDFGLRARDYCFVPTRYFGDRRPWRYSVPRQQTVNIYQESTVVNNYIVGNNNTIINNGVGHDFVVKNSRTEISRVAIADSPRSVRPGQPAPTRVTPDRVHKVGNDLVVYRPTPPPASAAANGGRVDARETTTSRSPVARYNSRPIADLSGSVASRPTSVERPSQRPQAVEARPTSPGLTTRTARPLPAPATSESSGVRSALRNEPTARAAQPIGGGLVTEQSSRPLARATAPESRPITAPTASEPDAISRSLREVRREGVDARIVRPGTPTAATRSIAPEATARTESPSIRRIEPIRSPAPITRPTAPVASAPYTPSRPIANGSVASRPFTRPSPPVTTTPAPASRFNRGDNEVRAISPHSSIARGNINPGFTPAPTVSAPTVTPRMTTPSFRSEVRQPTYNAPAPSVHPRFNQPAPSYTPPVSAPAVRSSPPIQTPSVRVTPQIQQSAPAPVRSFTPAAPTARPSAPASSGRFSGREEIRR